MYCTPDISFSFLLENKYSTGSVLYCTVELNTYEFILFESVPYAVGYFYLTPLPTLPPEILLSLAQLNYISIYVGSC